MTYTVPQSQTGAVEQPKFTDAQYRDKCFAITGTRCLHRLKQWCEERQISQTKWSDLTCNIISQIVNPTQSFKQQAFCCIQEEINEQAHAAEKICDALGLDVVELAPLYAPLVPPSGSGSHEVRLNGHLVGIIYQYGTEFHATHSEIYGESDPYTTTLTLLTPIDLATGKILAEKQRVANANSLMSGRFAGIPVPDYN